MEVDGAEARRLPKGPADEPRVAGEDEEVRPQRRDTRDEGRVVRRAVPLGDDEDDVAVAPADLDGAFAALPLGEGDDLQRRASPSEDRTASITVSASSSVIVGKIGSVTTDSARRSVTGSCPRRPPRLSL